MRKQLVDHQGGKLFPASHMYVRESATSSPPARSHDRGLVYLPVCLPGHHDSKPTPVELPPTGFALTGREVDLTAELQERAPMLLIMTSKHVYGTVGGCCIATTAIHLAASGLLLRISLTHSRLVRVCVGHSGFDSERWSHGAFRSSRPSPMYHTTRYCIHLSSARSFVLSLNDSRYHR